MNEERIISFYSHLRKFLVENKIEDEQELIGYSESEIQSFETLKNIKFPLSYRLFLQRSAKGNAFFFDGQDYTFEGIEIANQVAVRLLSDNQQIIEPNSFIFSQWQGYNFYYFINTDHNPKVKLFVEGDFKDVSFSYYDCDSFVNWLTERVVAGLNLKKQLDKMDVGRELMEIKKISTAASNI